MRQLDGAFNQIRLQIAAADREVEVDAGEDLGILFGALGFQGNVAATDVLAAFPQDQHDVIGGAAARAGKYHFHRARRQVAAAAFRRAIHGHKMARAGFSHKCHAGQASPAYGAFHRILAKIERALL